MSCAWPRGCAHELPATARHLPPARFARGLGSRHASKASAGSTSRADCNWHSSAARGGIVPADDVSGWLAPAALARGCAPCEWFLVTPCPPESRLLRKDVCSPCFTEAEPGAVWRPALRRGGGRRRAAMSRSPIAARTRCCCSPITGAGWSRASAFANPGPIAFAPWQEWLVVDAARNEHRASRSRRLCARTSAPWRCRGRSIAWPSTPRNASGSPSKSRRSTAASR